MPPGESGARGANATPRLPFDAVLKAATSAFVSPPAGWPVPQDCENGTTDTSHPHRVRAKNNKKEPNQYAVERQGVPSASVEKHGLTDGRRCSEPSGGTETPTRRPATNAISCIEPSDSTPPSERDESTAPERCDQPRRCLARLDCGRPLSRRSGRDGRSPASIAATSALVGK